MFEPASYADGSSNVAMPINNDYHNSQYKVDEYNNSAMNRSLYWEQHQTAPKTKRDYELDYSNPLVYPSNSSFRNLLENKYQTEANYLASNSTIMNTQSDKERIIEGIRRQMKREELLSKESKTSGRVANTIESTMKDNDYCKVYDHTYNSNDNEPSSRKQSIHNSIKEETNMPLYSQNVNSNSTKLNDVIKENESLKKENNQLRKENEELKNELNQIKSKDKLKGNTDLKNIHPDPVPSSSHDESQNDEFKNYLILENERLTKALNEIKPNDYQIKNAIQNIPSDNEIEIKSNDYQINDTIQNLPSNNENEIEAVKVNKKNKKKKKMKRPKSKKGKIATTIQPEYRNTNNNICTKHNNDKERHMSSKMLNEYNLDSPERIKFCCACLLGNNTFYKGYHPKNCSKEHHQINTNGKLTHRSKSKNKSRSQIKPSSIKVK